MGQKQELSLVEIETRYPHQWVLVEETSWDDHGQPVGGIVRAASVHRGDLRAPLKARHKHSHVKTFVFYTGDKIPTDVTVVL